MGVEENETSGLILRNLPNDITINQIETFTGIRQANKEDKRCSCKIGKDTAGTLAVIIAPTTHTEEIVKLNNSELQNNVITVNIILLEFFELRLQTTTDSPAREID